MNIFRSGSIWIFIAAILWALDGFLRRSLFALPPVTIVFYEHLIGLLILTPIFLPLLLKTKLSSKEWAGLTLVSLLSGLLGTLWFTAALVKVQFISISVVFLLQKLQPLFATTSAALILKEKLTKPYFLWGGLALIAAFFVTFNNGVINWDTGSGTAMAALLALGAAAAWGTSTTFSRLLLIDRPHELITGLRFLLTTVFAFGAVLIFGASGSLGQPNVDQFLTFGLIAVSTGMVALLLYYKGLKTTPVQVATIIELTFPMLVVVADAFINQTRLSWSQYVAALVLLIAMYQVSRLNQSYEVSKS